MGFRQMRISEKRSSWTKFIKKITFCQNAVFFGTKFNKQPARRVLEKRGSLLLRNCSSPLSSAYSENFPTNGNLGKKYEIREVVRPFFDLSQIESLLVSSNWSIRCVSRLNYTDIVVLLRSKQFCFFKT